MKASVTASGSAPSAGDPDGSGYVAADGDSTNQSLPSNCLDGYIAVNDKDRTATNPIGLVSDSNGNFDPAGGNDPTVPPSPSACT